MSQHRDGKSRVNTFMYMPDRPSGKARPKGGVDMLEPECIHVGKRGIAEFASDMRGE
jgi:hypothetical protein